MNTFYLLKYPSGNLYITTAYRRDRTHIFLERFHIHKNEGVVPIGKITDIDLARIIFEGEYESIEEFKKDCLIGVL